VLRAIPQVDLIRLGTRLPVTLAYRVTDGSRTGHGRVTDGSRTGYGRVTDELCEMPARYHPVWIDTLFNHSNELTAAVAMACDRLIRDGIPLRNQ